MIDRNSCKDQITMEVRYNSIMGVLDLQNELLSSRDITEKYIKNPTSSDVLVTTTILNVLSCTGMVFKKQKLNGNRILNTYKLDL